MVDGAIKVSSKTTEKLFRDGWQFFCMRLHKGQIEEALKEKQELNRKEIHRHQTRKCQFDVKNESVCTNGN